MAGGRNRLAAVARARGSDGSSSFSSSTRFASTFSSSTDHSDSPMVIPPQCLFCLDAGSNLTRLAVASSCLPETQTPLGAVWNLNGICPNKAADEGFDLHSEVGHLTVNDRWVSATEVFRHRVAALSLVGSNGFEDPCCLRQTPMLVDAMAWMKIGWFARSLKMESAIAQIAGVV
ncbi:hypothetical protein ACLOJK_023393 [Asimina triloba]